MVLILIDGTFNINASNGKHSFVFFSAIKFLLVLKGTKITEFRVE